MSGEDVLLGAGAGEEGVKGEGAAATETPFASLIVAASIGCKEALACDGIGVPLPPCPLPGVGVPVVAESDWRDRVGMDPELRCDMRRSISRSRSRLSSVSLVVEMSPE